MQQNDYGSFVDMLQAVAELYGKPLTIPAIAIYWNALKHLDLAVFREAMNRHVTSPDNGQFMPKPADLIRMTAGSSQDKALQAWHKVDKALRHVGTYRSVVFDDPLIHRALAEMGGWIALGTKTEDEWPFVARDFESRYRAFAGRQEVPEYPPVMIGQFEADNRKAGLRCEPPMLLGNPAIAKTVMLAGSSRPLLERNEMGVEQANKILKLVDQRSAAPREAA
ncbi:DUF6475 domain-containing protein [Chromobacterium violaceum]|uniref:DUF6475 domain-containing protein n=1 Tax=Chromobacterium violaceum TaxID=536 RepID=UPI001C8BF850|nr:DUF6475 domain-containing protein [Chromobacterium violaceum]MBX9267227.1 hypothetical protein [Chromobacterium violaceum]